METRKIQASKRSRLSAPMAVLATAGVFALLLNRYAAITLFALVALAWIANSVEVFGLRRRLEGQRVDVDEDEIVSRDREGKVTGRISLDRPFTYEYLDRAGHSALVSLRQGRQRVAFSSEEPAAERIVRDVLGQEWPPEDWAIQDL